MEAAALPRIDSDDPPVDLQLIGPFEKASGLGQATRLSASILEQTGVEVNCVNFGLDNPAPEGFSKVGKLGRVPPGEDQPDPPERGIDPAGLCLRARRLLGQPTTSAISTGNSTARRCATSSAWTCWTRFWVSTEYGVQIYGPDSARDGKPVVNVGMCYEDLRQHRPRRGPQLRRAAVPAVGGRVRLPRRLRQLLLRAAQEPDRRARGVPPRLPGGRERAPGHQDPEPRQRARHGAGADLEPDRGDLRPRSPHRGDERDAELRGAAEAEGRIGLLHLAASLGRLGLRHDRGDEPEGAGGGDGLFRQHGLLLGRDRLAGRLRGDPARPRRLHLRAQGPEMGRAGPRRCRGEDPCGLGRSRGARRRRPRRPLPTCGRTSRPRRSPAATRRGCARS